MFIKREKAAKTAIAREVFLDGGPELQARNANAKGEISMKKQLFSIVAAVAMCSAVALGQGGPSPVAMQQSGFMGGPGAAMMRGGGGRQFIEMRTRGPMGGGPMLWHRGHRMGPWWMNPEVAHKIGLSSEQKQQLEKISQDGLLRMIDLRANLEKQQVILRPMMQTYHPNEAEVLAQVEKVSMARTALEKARIQTMLASRNVLTEEQWTKLKDMRMPFRHTFMRRRGPMHHPMMPQKPMPPSK